MVKRVCFVVFMIVISSVSAPTEEDTFVVSTSYQNFLSNSEGSGMLDRIFTEAFSRIGREVEFSYNQTDQSLVDTNAGIFDGELNRISGMSDFYPNLVQVSEPSMIMEFVAFARTPLEISGWSSISDFSIGLVRGWKILEEQTGGFPWVVKVPTEVELFTMLNKDRIDVALYDLATGYTVIKELGFEGIFHLEPPLTSREMFLYLHKKHQDLAPELTKALQSMKSDGSYYEIIGEVQAQYGIPVR